MTKNFFRSNLTAIMFCSLMLQWFQAILDSSHVHHALVHTLRLSCYLSSAAAAASSFSQPSSIYPRSLVTSCLPWSRPLRNFLLAVRVRYWNKIIQLHCSLFHWYKFAEIPEKQSVLRLTSAMRIMLAIQVSSWTGSYFIMIKVICCPKAGMQNQTKPFVYHTKLRTTIGIFSAVAAEVCHVSQTPGHKWGL